MILLWKTGNNAVIYKYRVLEKINKPHTKILPNESFHTVSVICFYKIAVTFHENSFQLHLSGCKELFKYSLACLLYGFRDGIRTASKCSSAVDCTPCAQPSLCFDEPVRT